MQAECQQCLTWQIFSSVCKGFWDTCVKLHTTSHGSEESYKHGAPCYPGLLLSGDAADIQFLLKE